MDVRNVVSPMEKILWNNIYSLKIFYFSSSTLYMFLKILEVRGKYMLIFI
nr:MAG TPA: hypothetical protein [Crassvirales sp.]